MITGIDDYNRLEKFFDTAAPLKITLQIDGSAAYDFCCFGVDADEKLSDDRYMIFYNQLSSPNDEIIGAEIPSGMEFTVNLDALPSTICKLVFTCSIDGAGTMNEISRHKISVGDKISAEFVGADFKHKKKSIVSLEIYRNDGWRFNVAAREFGGGLDALLVFYGGILDGAPEDTSSEGTKKSFGKTIAKGGLKALKTVGDVTLEFGGYMLKNSGRSKNAKETLVDLGLGGTLVLTGFALQKAVDYVDKVIDDD